MLYSFGQGFIIGAGLIVAIGAQNAFVLTQSIRRNHALAATAICAGLDVLLIAVGVAGLGALVARVPALKFAATFGGAAFLVWFGARALLAAGKKLSLTADASAGPTGLRRVVLATLAVSLLNPHVYLDTVVMLGAISGQYPGGGRYAFGAGAAAASVIWFFSLYWAGRRLAPLFKKPLAWQVLNLCVGLLVWWIAVSLVRGYFTGEPGPGTGPPRGNGQITALYDNIEKINKRPGGCPSFLSLRQALIASI